MPSPLLYTTLILILSSSPALALPPFRRQVANGGNPSTPATTVSAGGSGGDEGGGVRTSTSASGPMTMAVTNPTAETAASSNSAGGGQGASGLSISVVIPVVVVAVVFVLLGIGLIYKKRISRRFRRGQPDSNSSMRVLTAEQISGTPSRTDANDLGGESGGAARAASRAPAAPVRGRGSRRGGGRRPRGDHLRRTESGRSVRTLPVYSEEAGDEELVLVRHRTNSTGSDRSYTLDTVDENAEQRLIGSQNSSPSLTAARIPLPVSPPPGDDIELQTRPSSTDGLPHSAPPVPNAGSEAAAHSTSDAARTNSFTRRGWGEAPTYLEAMSSPFFPSRNADLEANAPPPTVSLRTRTSSTFRGLLSRAGWGQGSSSNRGDQSPLFMSQQPSSATLSLPLLQPIASHNSTASSVRPGSVALSGYSSPWQSSLSISSPIPNTAVRASFDSARLPRAGLSDDQMRFLGSSEAVNLAGVLLGDPPEERRRRRGTNATSLSVSVFGEGGGSGQEEGEEEWGAPPTWAQAENERRNSSALSLAESSRSRSGSFGGREQEENGGGVEAGPAEPQPAQSAEAAVTGGKAEGSTEPEGKPRAGEDTLSPLTIIPTSASLAHTPTFEIEPPTPIASAAPSRVGSMVNPASRSA